MKPPPPPPPPPPPGITGAVAIVKVLVAVTPAKYFSVADALAVMVHEPAEVNVTTEPKIVQLPLAARTTGTPEEDDAETVRGPGIV
jgi:hypothetical protein